MLPRSKTGRQRPQHLAGSRARPVSPLGLTVPGLFRLQLSGSGSATGEDAATPRQQRRTRGHEIKAAIVGKKGRSYHPSQNYRKRLYGLCRGLQGHCEREPAKRPTPPMLSRYRVPRLHAARYYLCFPENPSPEGLGTPAMRGSHQSNRERSDHRSNSGHIVTQKPRRY